MLTFWKKKQFWGGVVAIIALALCLKDVSLEELSRLSERLNYWWVIPAVGGAFVFQILRALRWRVMISKQLQLPLIQGTSLYAAGTLLNAVMPALTGQVGRMFLFNRQIGLRKTFVFSTIVLEVLFDAISLIVILAATSVMFEFPEQYKELSFIIVGATIVGLILLWLILMWQQRLERFGRRRLRSRWPGTYIVLLKFLRSFVKGINLLKSTEHFTASLLYSVGSWVAHILVMFFLLHSFGLELGWTVAAGVMIIASIALMVPITPGNAGTFELVISQALVILAESSALAVTISKTDAVLIAFALHLVDLLPITLLGLTYVHFQKMSLRDIKRAHEKERLLDKISEDGTLIEEEQV